MKMNIKRMAVGCLAAGMLTVGAFNTVSAFNLGSFLGGVAKVGGISWLVSQYGEQLNSTINSVMMKEK